MRCYYEVLNVDRGSDDIEIKTAYKKLALKWHPDKNLDNIEDAKEQFQNIQQAYEVLSDRQERAWYDRHREQILRGPDKNYECNNIDVFPYFTTSCFKGYGDEEGGFYAVYRNLFDQIVKEDMEFMDDKEEYLIIPTFGNSLSNYDEVVRLFYNYWMSYSTKKTYVWLDPYDISSANRDRRVLKAIDKENKKNRLKARKERNEEVRNLVAFVRKRDKRVITWNKQNEVRIFENRKKQDEIRREKLLAQKLLNTSNVEAEWTKFDNLKEGLENIEKSLNEQFGNSENDTDSDDNDQSNLYCIVCNKIFKTTKSFQNHESSKKHKENVEILKADMLMEQDLVDNTLNSENDSVAELISASEDYSEESLSLENTECQNTNRQKKKNKRGKSIVQVSEILNEEIVLNHDTDEEDVHVFQKPKKKNTKKAKVKSNVKLEIGNNLDHSNSPIHSDSVSDRSTSKNSKQTKGKTAEIENKLPNLKCAVCKSTFPSKNKLFQHLKSTKHSIYLPSNAEK